jgi:hypothetical protein
MMPPRGAVKTLAIDTLGRASLVHTKTMLIASRKVPNLPSDFSPETGVTISSVTFAPGLPASGGNPQRPFCPHTSFCTCAAYGIDPIRGGGHEEFRNQRPQKPWELSFRDFFSASKRSWGCASRSRRYAELEARKNNRFVGYLAAAGDEEQTGWSSNWGINFQRHSPT